MSSKSIKKDLEDSISDIFLSDMKKSQELLYKAIELKLQKEYLYAWALQEIKSESIWRTDTYIDSAWASFVNRPIRISEHLNMRNISDKDYYLLNLFQYNDLSQIDIVLLFLPLRIVCHLDILQ